MVLGMLQCSTLWWLAICYIVRTEVTFVRPPPRDSICANIATTHACTAPWERGICPLQQGSPLTRKTYKMTLQPVCSSRDITWRRLAHLVGLPDIPSGLAPDLQHLAAHCVVAGLDLTFVLPPRHAPTPCPPHLPLLRTWCPAAPLTWWALLLVPAACGFITVGGGRLPGLEGLTREF